jgi:hypothetical protein
MFTTLDRPASQLYVPAPRFFFWVSAYVVIALLGAVKLLTVSVMYPRVIVASVLLAVVMLALVVGWAQAWGTYRRLRRLQCGDSTEMLLLHRYRIQSRRVGVGAASVTVLLAVINMLRM